MATLRNPRECTICNLEFNETNRRPRNLSCSHHLCGQCIDKLIISPTPFCPICRQYIKANTSLEFKVNFGVEDFMKFTSLTDAEKVEEEEAVKEALPMTRRMMKMTKEYDTITKQLMEDCQKRQDQLKGRMQNISPLKDDLNIAINKIETELKSKIDELIEENRKAIQNLEQETNQLLIQMIEARNKHRALASVTEALGKTQSSMNAALCLGRADMCLNDVEEWMENHELPPEQEDILKHATKVCRSTKEKTFLMIEVLNSIETDANVPLGGVTIYKKDTLPEVLTVEVLQGMNDQLKLLIEQGLLYAVQRVKGQTYSARFSISGRHLYLHYLKNKSPPGNARTLPYKQVASLVEKSSVLTFIEIGSKEEKIGLLHIRLLQNSYRAKNFALLCTGMKESTYVNSKLLETWGKGQTKEYVRGGDYDGDGGAPLVPIAMQQDRKNDPWSAGSVWGRRTEDSQFCISTRDDPEEKISGLFGRVEEGLDVLKKAIDSYPNIKQLKITDCGLVLPCSSLQHVTLDDQQA